jgi:hypothetical protein
MPSPSYLIRNRYSYGFRLRVPADLQEYVGKKRVAVFAASRLTGCSGATLSPEKASQENSISTIQGFPQLLAPGNADLHLSPLHLRNMALGDVRFLRKHFLSHPFPPAHGRNTTAGPSSSRISGKASRHGIELDTFICSTPP